MSEAFSVVTLSLQQLNAVAAALRGTPEPVAELSVAELSVAELSVAELSVAELSVAELSVAELSVVELSVVELSVVEPSVVEPSVVESSVVESSVAEPVAELQSHLAGYPAVAVLLYPAVRSCRAGFPRVMEQPYPEH
ncbi:MAG: hypothetical protein JWQ21_167 [Herminiimonas sp.]|nr:hypothetical protein [Herminiimonas sp.]